MGAPRMLENGGRVHGRGGGFCRGGEARCSRAELKQLGPSPNNADTDRGSLEMGTVEYGGKCARRCACRVVLAHVSTCARARVNRSFACARACVGACACACACAWVRARSRVRAR
eukprot:5133206-Pleurochrysis_carterae.AAC.1